MIYLAILLLSTEYIYSGYAIISIKPADDTAVMLELNNAKSEFNNKNKNKEDTIFMDENIKAEFEKIKAQIAELNGVELKNTEINNLTAVIAEKDITIEQLKELLAENDKKYADLNREYDLLYTKERELRELIAQKEIEASLAEMNNALAAFSDEEKECVKDLIEKNKAEPGSVEINAIVDKIKAVKFDKIEAQKLALEQNSFKGKDKNTLADIFGSMDEKTEPADAGGFY